MDKEKIVKALNTTSILNGVVCINDITHDIGYKSGYIDSYLAVGVLAELIDKGIVELKFNEPINDKDKQRLDYFKKLLEEE